ncbi:hypothetical protein SLEP1_g26854 [Rubroshorea leprosula]|uniref:Reverse transcriptase domain-containing protein n=1 Tax=Rubroshorea leprosula TaxID=152421 RepID=A0AAV5JX52_9ROSI|nr:hypothetical protein SLEP1_g26854 [Rubroshorea leprosula]
MATCGRDRSIGKESKKHVGQDMQKRYRDRSRHDHRQSGNRKVWKEKGRGDNWASMEFNIKPEEYAWLEGSYVGIVHSMEMVRNLQEKFYMEGYFSCQIRAMGGKMVLLSGQDKEEVKDLVEMASDWLRRWFEEVRPWTPQMIAKERFVWIRCQGAPLNVWGSEFFSTMGRSWGKFICLDDSTSKKERFDIARFFISSPVMETINVTREIKINGSIYKLKFTEEEYTNCFFSLKQDFRPSFSSDFEDYETWSTGTESKMQDEEDERRKEKVPSGCSIEEDDDGESPMAMESTNVEVAQKETLLETPITVQNRDMYGIGKSAEEKGNEEEDAFWKDHESKKSRIKEWIDKQLEEINSKNGRRKVRRCSSVYIQPRNSEAPVEKKRGRKKKIAQQVEERPEPIFMPNQEGKVAGDSIGDSEINNCNRALKKQWQSQLTKEIWDLATQLGAVAENDNEVIQRIEEMEDRDRSTKRSMVNREVEAGGKVDWGPKPFRFFNAWLDQSRCKEVITSAWCDNEVDGWNGFKIKEKMKRTKKALKEWSGKTNREMDERIRNAELVIASIDEKGEQHQLSENDIELRRNSFIELWKNLKIKERMSQQKSRKQWLKEGDANTKFFHRSIKGRWSKNEINSVRINGEQYIGVEVLPKVIGEQQMAFIEGRHLVEGAVIANEIIDEVKRKKKKGFLFKVDFEKAYDKVCWEFIEYIMMRMGFCATWRKWIQECLKSSLVSILVNGSPKNQFSVNKGIRQGDPLSPFLFLIVAEGLNGIVASAVEKGRYKGVVIGSKDVMVTHLQFADDTIFFGDATEDNIWVIKCIMRTFELASGLKINFKNSQLIGVGVDQNWCAKMAFQLCCKEGKLPFRSEGLEEIQFGIDGKMAGKACRKWGRHGEGMWKKIIVAKYGKGGGHWQDWIDESRGVGSTWWRDVCGINAMDGESNGWLKEGFRVKIGEEKTKTCSEMGSRTNGLWEWNLTWRRNLFEWEKEEAMELHNTIQNVQPSQGYMDSWEWTHNKDGQYSTKSAYSILMKEGREAMEITTFSRIWNSVLPSKISAFNWQLLLDRIPTKMNLLTKGIIKDTQDCKCGICGEVEEDTKHLFLECSMGRWIWMACAKWWGINVTLGADCWNTFQVVGRELKEKCIREGWDCIWNSLVWTVWLARNQKTFQGKEINREKLLELIQLKSFH